MLLPFSSEILQVQNTSLSNNGLDHFCFPSSTTNDDNVVANVRITADCDSGAGKSPFDDDTTNGINCPCCTTCCNSNADGNTTSSSCAVNLPAICEIAKSTYEYDHADDKDMIDNNNDAHQRRQLNCECSDTGNSFNCLDDNCVTCNQDETICAQSISSGLQYDEEYGHAIKFTNTFQYVKDDNNVIWSPFKNNMTMTTMPAVMNVTFEEYIDEIHQLETCDLYINGQKCQQCIIKHCRDNYFAHRGDCSNIPGLEDYQPLDVCGGKVDPGPLAILSLQDPLLRNSLDTCKPIFNGLTIESQGGGA